MQEIDFCVLEEPSWFILIWSVRLGTATVWVWVWVWVGVVVGVRVWVLVFTFSSPTPTHTHTHIHTHPHPHPHSLRQHAKVRKAEGRMLRTRATQVESSDHGFRSNPIGNTTGFSRKYSNFDAIRSEPVGLLRNPRCRKPIGFRRKISDRIRQDSHFIRSLDSVGNDEIRSRQQSLSKMVLNFPESLLTTAQ